MERGVQQNDRTLADGYRPDALRAGRPRRQVLRAAHGSVVQKPSNSGRRLLLPPADWRPMIAVWTAQASAICTPRTARARYSVRDPTNGLSSKKMALITSDYDTVCSLRIKWPVSPLEQLRPSFRPRVHNRPARVEHPMLCHPMPEGRTTRGDTGHLMRRGHTTP